MAQGRLKMRILNVSCLFNPDILGVKVMKNSADQEFELCKCCFVPCFKIACKRSGLSQLLLSDIQFPITFFFHF